MKIIVWLWNPWLEYSETRHNIGFLFIDYLREKLWFEDFKDSHYKWIISEWNLNWEKIILLKPITYMNLSWESVYQLINFYKLDYKKDIIVIFDDISMNFGKIRFRDKWSAGWHNGIKSLIKCFWNEEFARIKIWVWLDSRYDVSDWVLSKFNKNELKELQTHFFPQSLQLLEDKFIS